MAGQEQETTEQGLLQALLAGDISTDEFLQMSEQGQQPDQTESEIEEQAATCPTCGSTGIVPTASGRCPRCGAVLAGEEGPACPPPRRGALGPQRRPGAARARPGGGFMGVPSSIKREPAMAGSFESQQEGVLDTVGQAAGAAVRGLGRAAGAPVAGLGKVAGRAWGSAAAGGDRSKAAISRWIEAALDQGYDEETAARQYADGMTQEGFPPSEQDLEQFRQEYRRQKGSIWRSGESLGSFESLVSEACKPRPKKKTKKPKQKEDVSDTPGTEAIYTSPRDGSKYRVRVLGLATGYAAPPESLRVQETETGRVFVAGRAFLDPISLGGGSAGRQKESLEEFGAPEFHEVAMWARGQEVKRNSETQPYYFLEDKMFSRKVQIAVRDLDEKKARVLSPKVLDAYSGRHSVLAQHGLKSCGFEIEIVESLPNE